ncbi:hypothetical protein D3C85_783470 [compost metagenome]
MRSACESASPRLDSSPVPGVIGTPASAASSRERCFRPNSRICKGVGPTKAMPAASQASANSALSDRKP